ncbi:hypothetical protein ABFX02_14G038900 [Erythranthe guttata]
MAEVDQDRGLVYDIKLSSVGPGNVTGQDSIFEARNMDLAMKLHYIRCVYYFGSRAFEGLTTLAIKEPIFVWLNRFPMTAGRFRRDESGRPYIKCNDCGVRFIEAKCRTSLDEWFETSDDSATREKFLCSNQIIGPELSFSPLIYIQLTKFKCGGMAVGLSWAHVLGDVFSAAEYMNNWSRVATGFGLNRPINKMADGPTKPKYFNGRVKVSEDPLSVKRVDPVGDNWVFTAKCKMAAFSFEVTPTQLSHLRSKLSTNGIDSPAFEAISAVIWRCIAGIRGGESEPRIVTICKRSEDNEKFRVLRNNQVVLVVKAESPVMEANPSDLAALMKNGGIDDRAGIEEAVERDHGLPDFIVYGANLTFVNLEGADFYDFEYSGQKPVRVSCRIDGVGENGAVLVLPAAGEGGGGRSVMAILPENEVAAVKSELKREGLLLMG